MKLYVYVSITAEIKLYDPFVELQNLAASIMNMLMMYQQQYKFEHFIQFKFIFLSAGSYVSCHLAKNDVIA